jgi:hypothetical protein
MGIIPATGTEISMGRVGQAYGLGAPGTVSLSLRSTLAQAVNNFGDESPINLSGSVGLSVDFGGRTTPNDY